MPAGLPLHDSMEPIEADEGYIAAWETTAVPQEIYTFFVDELPAAGFVVNLAAPGGDAAILRFTSPDGIAYQLDLTGHFPMEVALGPPHD
jgi:hypothetical protein